MRTEVQFAPRTLALIAVTVLGVYAADAPKSARGTLVQRDGMPAIETADHRIVWLSGDDSVTDVVNDERLRGMDFEALGQFTDPSHFRIAPSYLRPLFVYKDGKRLAITYWCGTCAIRTWRPGECWCCHKYTDLDLRAPDEN